MIEPGSKLAHYEVVSALGKGGMGEVWRAKDTKLGREVAIKTLPAEFAQDADRLARFEREAKLLASLNHPNIAAIHGFEEDGGVHFLIMELVEGDTLADRVGRGAIPVVESLTLAFQIADALKAAHEKGVIHRDLKPANIKVTDNNVKVLDFGLAKAFAGEEIEQSSANSPTLSMQATQQGVILGTAAYMSPEQAKGRTVDKRADVWAFGCVLYEMLTGRQSFGKSDVTESLASVITLEPEWTNLPTNLHPRLLESLERCLQKQVAKRYQDIGDVRADIETVLADPRGVIVQPVSEVVPEAPRSNRKWVAATLVFGIIASALAWNLKPIPVLEETFLEISTGPIPLSDFVRVSPDGRSILFIAASDSGPQLWIRSLDSDQAARPLPGTDETGFAFWSTDSRSIGFISDRSLLRFEVESDSVTTVVSGGVDSGYGASWGSNGQILAVRGGELVRVHESGTSEPEIVPLDIEGIPLLPDFLPDGNHFLILEASGTVHLASLDSTQVRSLVDADSSAIYADPGRILYIREGTLYSHGFDPEDMELRGEPVAETDLTAVFSILPASASDTGVLVYRRPGGVRQFIWMDRDGIVLDRIGSIMGSNAASPELSPDGDQAVFEQSSGSTGQINLWLLDLVRGGSAAPFTFENHIVAQPAWAPDGRIAFFSDLNFPDREILARPSDGVGSEELLLAVPGKQLLPQDWAADGQFLLFDQIEPDTSELQIWALESGSNEPILIVNSPGSDLHGQFSPEADWIAYESDRSGTTEVYIQPFDGSGAAVPVSIGGGDQARWNPDGTEVFYVAPPSQLMSVTLDFSTDRRTVERGQPDELFTAPLGGPSRSRGQFYDVSSDGEKFLILSMLETAPPVTVILNWNPNDE